MAQAKQYLVVRASGGLSNRLQALLGGIAFCLLTGRSLCVDWRDGLYSDDFSNVFPLWFQILGVDVVSCQEVEKAFHHGALVAPSFWEEYLCEAVAVEYLFNGDDHMSAQGRADSCYDISQSDVLSKHELFPDILVYWGWDLRVTTALSHALRQKFPQWKDLNDTALARALLQNHMRPTAPIHDAVEEFYTKHFTRPPVGIHIRHSDLQSPLPRMLEKLAQVHTGEDELFLCTDNALVEKMVRRIYPHCVIRDKIFQGVNVPLHSYVSGISNVQKGFDAVVEMLLLARCAHIIHYAPSSFARISILQSRLSAENVHAVT